MPHRKWGLALAAAAAVCGLGEAQGDEALAKIKTIVIIYAENRSFDHLYGFFPGANGIANATEEQKTQLDHDAVHRTDAARERIDFVDEPERSFFMRDGQVAAGKAKRRERPQRCAQISGGNGQRHVGAGKPVLGEPIIVQLGRARMHHRVAHHAGEQEAIRAGYRHSRR